MSGAITRERFAKLVRGNKRLLRNIDKELGIVAADDPEFLEMLWLFCLEASAADPPNPPWFEWSANDFVDRGYGSVRVQDLLASSARQQAEAEALRKRAKPAGRPRPHAFNTLMTRLARYHAARVGVTLRVDSIKRELLAGRAPAEVAVRHSVSIDVIEQRFALYIAAAQPGLTLTPPPIPEEAAGTVDAAPGFFKVAAAVTDLLHAMESELLKREPELRFGLPPKNNTALQARLRRIGLSEKMPRPRPLPSA